MAYTVQAIKMEILGMSYYWVYHIYHITALPLLWNTPVEPWFGSGTIHFGR